jgi:hypothetical protein
MSRHSYAEPGADSDSAAGPDAPEDPRPTRPALVELAAAILIVGGTIGLVGLVTRLSNVPAGLEPFLALTVALDVGSIVMGLLVRAGRAWIVAVNYVAVLGFLDLLASGGSPLALMLGLADVGVVVILVLNKPWFDATAEWRARRRSR